MPFRPHRMFQKWSIRHQYAFNTPRQDVLNCLWHLKKKTLHRSVIIPFSILTQDTQGNALQASRQHSQSETTLKCLGLLNVLSAKFIAYTMVVVEFTQDKRTMAPIKSLQPDYATSLALDRAISYSLFVRCYGNYYNKTATLTDASPSLG